MFLIDPLLKKSKFIIAKMKKKNEYFFLILLHVRKLTHVPSPEIMPKIKQPSSSDAKHASNEGSCLI